MSVALIVSVEALLVAKLITGKFCRLFAPVSPSPGSLTLTPLVGAF